MCLFLFVCLFVKLIVCFILGPQNPLCAKACKRDGPIKPSFSAAEFGEVQILFYNSKGKARIRNIGTCEFLLSHQHF